MKIVAGLSGISSNTGSFRSSYDEIVNIDAPKSLTDADFKKLTRDCELFLSRMRENPKKIQKIINLGLAGDTLEMVELKKELRLREEDFEREGGGFIWWLLLLILLLLPKCAK